MPLVITDGLFHFSSLFPSLFLKKIITVNVYIFYFFAHRALKGIFAPLNYRASGGSFCLLYNTALREKRENMYCAKNYTFTVFLSYLEKNNIICSKKGGHMPLESFPLKYQPRLKAMNENIENVVRAKVPI